SCPRAASTAFEMFSKGNSGTTSEKVLRLIPRFSSSSRRPGISAWFSRWGSTQRNARLPSRSTTLGRLLSWPEPKMISLGPRKPANRAFSDAVTVDVHLSVQGLRSFRIISYRIRHDVDHMDWLIGCQGELF